jgi:hypothetical protein
VRGLLPKRFAWLAVALALAAAPAWSDGPSLVRSVGDAEVDWSAGTITARGGAAADFRMPSADVARPGAERRARAAAAAKLKAALEALPLGTGHKLSAAERETAVGRARAAGVEYQSNGGVLLSLSLSFSDVFAGKEKAPDKERAPDAGVEAGKAPEQALSVASMPFELAPRLVAGERDGALSFAVYRIGSPPSGVAAIPVHRDHNGRLVLPKAEATTLQKLSGAPAVIYVQKAPK